MTLKTITMQWTGDSLILIDQRKLPHVVENIVCKSYEEVAQADRKSVV